MKRVLCVLLLAFFLLVACACGSRSETETGEASKPKNEEQTQTLQTKAEEIAENSLSTRSQEDAVTVVETALHTEEYVFYFNREQNDLAQQFNRFLSDIQKDGRYEQILNCYFGDGIPRAINSAEADSQQDQLTVAVNAAYSPFEYAQDGAFYGVDLEILKLFAEEMEKELVIRDMAFSLVCDAVIEGDCQIAAGALTVEPEREERMISSAVYYDASLKIVCWESDNLFVACQDEEQMQEKMKSLPRGTTFGALKDSAARLFITGDSAFNYEGFSNLNCVSYDAVSTAVEDLKKEFITYVIADASLAELLVNGTLDTK